MADCVSCRGPDRAGADGQAADRCARARAPPSCGAIGGGSGRDRRRAGGPRPHQRGARSRPRAGHHSDRPAQLARSIWPRPWRSWPTRPGSRAGESASRSSRPGRTGRPGHRGPAGGALRRLAPGALGGRFLQDPPLGERHAVVPGDRASRGARRPRGVAGARDGHRSGPLPGARRSPRRGTARGRPVDERQPIERLLVGEPLSGPRVGTAGSRRSARGPRRPRPPRDSGRCAPGCAKSRGVVETVRFMGATWRWAWEYGIGNRKLCWLHFIGNWVSATFTLSDDGRETGCEGRPAWPPTWRRRWPRRSGPDR